MRNVLVSTALLLTLFFGGVAYAQDSSATLRATIRSQLLSDPRTASLSEAQLSAMVDLLTSQAEERGMTSEDLQWHPERGPQPAAQSAVIDYCAGSPRFLCLFSMAWGFVGPDTLIAYILGISSMGLVWILAEMIHRRRHPLAAASASPPVAQ